jgi:hypothetical protein
MKRIVFFAFLGSLMLALTAWGAPKDKQQPRLAKARSAPSAHVASSKIAGHADPRRVSGRAARVAPIRAGGGHSLGRAGAYRGGRFAAPRMRSAPAMHRAAPAGTFARSRAAVHRERAIARASTMRANRIEAAKARNMRNLARANALPRNRTEAATIRNERIAQATRAVARRNLGPVNRQRNLTLARNVLHNRAGNIRIVNNWRSDRFRDPTYAAFYNYTPTWHDRAWWRSHFTRIVFVLGGWWAWWDGYWYPCWGYDPYVWYWYDGPIYTGYADLTPDRVIISVQVALRDWGYYAGPIDGIMGPQTRAALAAFQADHGLLVTSAIDRPTLQMLGIT